MKLIQIQLRARYRIPPQERRRPPTGPTFEPPEAASWAFQSRTAWRMRQVANLFLWEEIWPGPAMKLVGPLAARSPGLPFALALEISVSTIVGLFGKED